MVQFEFTFYDADAKQIGWGYTGLGELLHEKIVDFLKRYKYVKPDDDWPERTIIARQQYEITIRQIANRASKKVRANILGHVESNQKLLEWSDIYTDVIILDAIYNKYHPSDPTVHNTKRGWEDWQFMVIKIVLG